MTEIEHDKYPDGYDVYFEKWEDAYDLEDLKEQIEQYNNDKDENEYDDKYGDLYPFMEEDHPLFKKGVETLFTPHGILPVTEKTLASKKFKFWVGYTNFNVSIPVCQMITSVPGVETFDALTRYRFRIGIGKIFRDRDVMANIRATLKQYLDQKDAAKEEL